MIIAHDDGHVADFDDKIVSIEYSGGTDRQSRIDAPFALHHIIIRGTGSSEFVQ